LKQNANFTVICRHFSAAAKARENMPAGIFQKKTFQNRRVLEKPKINMTPMIDVVFLFLTFFVMTFRIMIPEGDFNIKMQEAGQAVPAAKTEKTAKIVLTADNSGNLSAIVLNGVRMTGFNELRQKTAEMSRQTDDLEAEILPDEHLQYEFIIRAVSAVSGEIAEGKLHKICEKIRFVRSSPPLHR
jgi:biopolymer transport protein ExbD